METSPKCQQTHSIPNAGVVRIPDIHLKNVTLISETVVDDNNVTVESKKEIVDEDPPPYEDSRVTPEDYCENSAKQSTENSYEDWRNGPYTRSKTYYNFNRENFKTMSESEEFIAMAENFEKSLNKYLPRSLRQIQPPKKYILPYMNESTLPVHITVIRSLYKIWILQVTIVFIAGFVALISPNCQYHYHYTEYRIYPAYECTFDYLSLIANLIAYFCIFPAVSYYSYIYSSFMALRNHSPFHCIVFVFYSTTWVLSAAIIILFGFCRLEFLVRVGSMALCGTICYIIFSLRFFHPHPICTVLNSLKQNEIKVINNHA